MSKAIGTMSATQLEKEAAQLRRAASAARRRLLDEKADGLENKAKMCDQRREALLRKETNR